MEKKAKQGDAYELIGAFGEPFFLPKVMTDAVDWKTTMEANEIQLQWIQQFLEWTRRNRQQLVASRSYLSRYEQRG